MKNTFIRVMSLILVLIMMVSSFASCNNNTGDGNGATDNNGGDVAGTPDNGGETEQPGNTPQIS